MSDPTKPTLAKVPAADDDLDDLDDVLDEFNDSKPASGSQAPPPSATFPPPSPNQAQTSGRPRTNTRVDTKPPSVPGVGPPLHSTAEVDEDELSSEFAKELAKGMESLMRELSGGALPGEGANDGDEGGVKEDDEQTKALKAAWEAMLIEGMNGQAGEDLLPSLGDILGEGGQAGAPRAAEAPSSSSGAAPENFQERIKQAMGKMKEGENDLRAAAGAAAPGTGADGSPESIADLLKSLEDLGLGEGGENDSELAGFLESMMGQLMSKEILYEPLKELADSFPPYLANPPQQLSSEDRTRYEKQLACVTRIVTVFESSTYSDTNPESNKQIVDLMSEMQSYGSPPSELMGPLPAGFDGGLPGVDPNDPNCTIA
ncbi:Pex19-domain-containing protein [Coprinopsis marcescibilis]|uniref:Pex19-domain-containing protein n=1 Tax=Coprinopsis marcescibilis TaxID=230819 RepID=A0A5C3KG73_COPMA|nr:Pex19-domain-containing protein [Coprinopsis marcescibilis]